LVASVVAADQGRTEIGPTDAFPIVIDEPGSYVLTADLHVTTPDTNAINIVTNEVSLDLGGHVIRGSGPMATTGVGINAYFKGGLSISNGSIVEFNNGIQIHEGGGASGANHLRNLTVARCGDHGIYLAGGTARDIAVYDNGTASNDYGFFCSYCTATNVTARSNKGGILVAFGSATGCTAVGNEFNGFTVQQGTLNTCTATHNEQHGIYGYAQTVVIGAVVSYNDQWGIMLESSGSSNVVNSAGGNNGSGNISGCYDGNGCHQNYLP
jgi:hypothetical protein